MSTDRCKFDLWVQNQSRDRVTDLAMFAADERVQRPRTIGPDYIETVDGRSRRFIHIKEPGEHEASRIISMIRSIKEVVKLYAEVYTRLSETLCASYVGSIVAYRNRSMIVHH